MVDLKDIKQVYHIEFTASADTAYITHLQSQTPIGYSGLNLVVKASPWLVYHEGDETLFYMKYSGNTALIRKAEQAYPEYHITQIIPEGEFEATMYRCFGGDVKITHKNGERFFYLPKVNAYISPVMPEDSGLRARIVSIDETNRTWRVRFQVLPEDGEADRDTVTYFALVIKREDGTLYIKKLLTEEDVKNAGNGFFRKKES